MMGSDGALGHLGFVYFSGVLPPHRRVAISKWERLRVSEPKTAYQRLAGPGAIVTVPSSSIST